MGFDDLFEKKDHYKHDKYHQQYHPGNHQRDGLFRGDKYHHDHAINDHGYYPKLNTGYFIMTIRNNPKLRMVIIAGGIIILFVLLLLVIVMMPLIIKLIGYIEKAGIQGVLEWITSILDKLWKGSGK